MEYPKITIVTPSYNQGQFLEETIQSVIGQQYPNLEYIIMDGGSTDNSVEIIKKYEHHLAFWVSEKDEGQSAAINVGFAKSTGEILGWLNSDDMYLPGTLAYIASRLDPNQPEIIFGNCVHINQEAGIAFGSDVRKFHAQMNLSLTDYLIQPSSFWTRKAMHLAGALDQSLDFGFDWEWFLRARQAGVRFVPEDKYLSVYRIHGEHKTAIGGERRLQELASIHKKHAGVRYERLFLRCCSRRSQILFLRKWIRMLRLTRFEGALLKTAFPFLFRGFTRSEAADITSLL
jgi:glycosyltransferase involved in cell wall biosynthesis